jgi:cob(I)alamin adenosyltransferase
VEFAIDPKARQKESAGFCISSQQRNAAIGELQQNCVGDWTQRQLEQLQKTLCDVDADCSEKDEEKEMKVESVR